MLLLLYNQLVRKEAIIMRKRRTIKPMLVPMPEPIDNHCGLYKAYEHILNMLPPDNSQIDSDLIGQLWEKRGRTPIMRCRIFSLHDLSEML
jgi:hypothetical protein